MFPGLPSLLVAFLAATGTGRAVESLSTASATPPSPQPIESPATKPLDTDLCSYGSDISHIFRCRALERVKKYQYLGIPVPGALHNVAELCEQERREFDSTWDRVRPTGTRYRGSNKPLTTTTSLPSSPFPYDTPPSSTRCQSVSRDPYYYRGFQCDALKRVRRYQELGIPEPEAIDIVDALCKEEQRQHSTENAWRTRPRERKYFPDFDPTLESPTATPTRLSYSRDIYPPFQCLALEHVRGYTEIALPVPEHLRNIDAACKEEHKKFLAEPGWHYTWPNYQCGAWERVRKYEELGFPVSDALRDFPARCSEEWDEYDAIRKRRAQKEEDVPISPPIYTPYLGVPATESGISNAPTSHSLSVPTPTFPLSSFSPTRSPYIHDFQASYDYLSCLGKLGYIIRRRTAPEILLKVKKCMEELQKARVNEKKIDEGTSTVTPSSTNSSSPPAPTPPYDQDAHRAYSNHVLSCLAKLAVDYRKPIPPEVLLKVNQCLEQSQRADADKTETGEETSSVALSPSSTPTSPPDSDITGNPTTPEPGHKTPPAPLTTHQRRILCRRLRLQMGALPDDIQAKCKFTWGDLQKARAEEIKAQKGEQKQTQEQLEDEEEEKGITNEQVAAFLFS